MDVFLHDYPDGRKAGRYVDAALPELQFADRAFDLALCANFLFLYSSQHDLEFHVSALLELARVSAEVRVFPLMELGSVPSRHLSAATQSLQDCNLIVDSIAVPYELQRGGNRMLRILHRE